VVLLPPPRTNKASRLERGLAVNGVVRISAKAVIVVDGRVLLLKHRDGEGDWYGLPGGGQRHGETLAQAVERECFEETGLRVRMGRLLFVRDYIAKNHEFAQEDGDAHQVELMFECTLAGGGVPRVGAIPDAMQIGVEWVDLVRLRDLRMYPRAMASLLAAGVRNGHPVYLGDVN
jgi:ADP-ribose pyrophosphatase YjhB (NUDIX family)